MAAVIAAARRDRRAPPPDVAAPVSAVASRAVRKAEERRLWDLHSDASAVSDPRRTVFLGRLPRGTTAAAVDRFARRFGAVTAVALPRDLLGDPRPYAFVEFTRPAEARSAAAKADGELFEGARVVAAMMAGRINGEFLPKRLRGEDDDSAIFLSNATRQAIIDGNDQ